MDLPVLLLLYLPELSRLASSELALRFFPLHFFIILPL